VRLLASFALGDAFAHAPLVVDVGELAHDSGDIAVLDRRLDERIVAIASLLRKMPFLGRLPVFAHSVRVG
jgi:hypothetical protein